MPYTRPTLKELTDRIKSDLSSTLTGNAVPLRRSVISVIATVVAGANHLLYGFMLWILRQVMVTTAEEDYLAQIAILKDLSRKPAAFAEGNITFTGANGETILAETELVRADGARFETLADGVISGGTATVSARALEAGEAGNCDAGETLNLVSPQPNVQSQATVAVGGLSGGADQEPVEAFRARTLLKFREPPHGGNASDYKQWALEVPGVTRVWVYSLLSGEGTVGVCFVRDDDSGTLIPDSGEVADVQSYLNARAPIGADVTVFAPTASPLNFTISVSPNISSVKAAVEAELRDLIRREAEPGGTLFLSHIREAISIAAGENNHVLTTPNADVTVASGVITTFGMITWT